MYKNYTLTLSWSTYKNGVFVDCTRNAALNCDGEQFTLRDIRTFLDDVKKIYKQINGFKKNNTYFRVELSIAVYQRKESDKYYNDQKAFDFWSFSGYIQEGDDGIMLRADEKYTPANLDIWLEFKGDILTDICDRAYWSR